MQTEHRRTVFREGLLASSAMGITPKGWNAVIDANLNGSRYMMQAAAKRWEQHGQPGNIINVVAVKNWGDPWFGGRPRYFDFDYDAARHAE